MIKPVFSSLPKSIQTNFADKRNPFSCAFISEREIKKHVCFGIDPPPTQVLRYDNHENKSEDNEEQTGFLAKKMNSSEQNDETNKDSTIPPSNKKGKKSKKNQKKKKENIVSNIDHSRPPTKHYEVLHIFLDLGMDHYNLYCNLLKYVLSDAELRQNRFPHPQTLSFQKNFRPVSETFRICIRCRESYEILENGDYVSSTKCLHHPLKAVFDEFRNGHFTGAVV
ncbi:hypothetical protein CEXT_465471 [Caerostris extrusa]|uniref:Uncharacterized protein n=1 Tax=Caerostris extrusa TaxID=172846 RepID=A0AAV4N0H3_CAEEX|nr:hypothetical protein CEXT_465471 [Caerostris extrusa]